ncbi:Serine/threonine-protein kinase TEL1 [Neolecta irregularis DAH-3]|uniref:Serine/threonine-protein kinase TEL1 n=1 Tax=Neolecta irregularis (strain DAH-3) TaxID=1198029 RepID=A0A1U7LTN3_NEOID|nr:Serine/threonine-protein kinase TEL1 [Neolecta irregularis DAH-3]|eukprot:OLL25989.1 Serine/threonine-protein kinase TEL1 [Neolecta irregularis DAH-3]
MRTGAICGYLENALNELNQGKCQWGELFYTYAEICSSQYEQPEFNDEMKHAQEIFLKKDIEVQALKASYLRNTDDIELKRRFYIANKMRNSDSQELSRLQQRSRNYLETAIRMYLECLKICDDFDDCIFRLCALWLSKYDQTLDSYCYTKFRDVASHKFIRIFNQLSSRLDIQQGLFQEVLVQLLTRVVAEHPFHTIYAVFAIQNMTSSSNAAYDTSPVNRSRSQAAKFLLDGFSQINSSMASLRSRVERLVKSYIDLGVIKPNTQGQSIKLPENKHRVLFKDLPRWKFPNPTSKIPISITKNYAQMPIIQNIDPNVKVASGNSKPLVFKVLDSDGIWHRQIVKNGDDLRQDSVMEQVFDEVNIVLQRRRETRYRSLTIKTYVVVPLYPRGGLIQWVDNTTALKEYLNSRHHKYYKHDLKFIKCHELVGNAQGAQRIKAFKNVLENFHPVMNHLFLEDYTDPEVWFSTRVRYARSLAIISIVGEIIGLGDRHGFNILFDQQTGEVVNIDLGIAFEKVACVQMYWLDSTRAKRCLYPRWSRSD